MESFRTTFKIPENSSKIDYSTKILSLGSCFSENIGEKLTKSKFQALINPFGILYNPESIAQSLELLLTKKAFTVSELFENQGVWNSFYHHSRFSDPNKYNCLHNINSSLKQASGFLNETQYLLITFGTAWVYELKSTKKVVSNCHKLPAKEFNREKLSVTQIIGRYQALINILLKNNPKLNLVFTVSPVRHLNDGANQNQISKATLILAVHELVSAFKNVSYFPSYEIMVDDLRDYRFYNNDMLHPSPVAVNYIWDKFCETYISAETKKVMAEIEKINQAIDHRPFNPNSESHQKFIKTTIDKISKLKAKHAAIDFGREKERLESFLI